MVRHRLNEIRMRMGLTQAEVAALTGVSRVTIWRIDRDPDYPIRGSILDKLVTGLHVKVSDLLTTARTRKPREVLIPRRPARKPAPNPEGDPAP